MEQIESVEGKLFYKIYMLCKGNQINESQKGKLKDLIIQKDERMELAMTKYLEDKDETRLLENFHNYSSDEQSPKSINDLSDGISIGSSSKFKGKRPAKMQLPLKTFMINLRKNTDLTISSKGFYTSTARSGGNRNYSNFNERFTQSNWSECE